MVRDIISLNSSFNNFPSAWHMVGVFKDVLLNIRTSVLYDRNFSLCVLIPRYGCFMVELCVSQIQSLHRIWSFSLRMFSVNVFKSAVSCGFGYIYWRNLFTFTEEIFGAVNGTTPLSLRIIIVCQSLGCFRKIFKL